MLYLLVSVSIEVFHGRQPTLDTCLLVSFNFVPISMFTLVSLCKYALLFVPISLYTHLFLYRYINSFLALLEGPFKDYL